MFEKLGRSQSQTQPQLVKPGREGDQKRAEALEQQVKILASTASEAVDRASELEEEVRHLRQVTRSASQQSALSSFSISTNESQLKSYGSMNSLFSVLSTDTGVTIDEEDSVFRKGEATFEHQLDQERKLRIAAEEKIDQLSKSLSVAANCKLQLEKRHKVLEETDNAREKRLHTLEIALQAIHSARKELNSIRHYKYV